MTNGASEGIKEEYEHPNNAVRSPNFPTSPNKTSRGCPCLRVAPASMVTFL